MNSHTDNSVSSETKIVITLLFSKLVRNTAWHGGTSLELKLHQKYSAWFEII